MKTVKVELNINAPKDIVHKAFSDYDHAPILHKRYVKSVKVLEQAGNVSIALWHLKILWFWSTVKQRQEVFPPDRIKNETIGGLASGTIENTYLTESIKGTDILDIIDIRVSKLGRVFEKIIASYTKKIVTDILLDHKQNLES